MQAKYLSILAFAASINAQAYGTAQSVTPGGSASSTYKTVIDGPTTGVNSPTVGIPYVTSATSATSAAGNATRTGTATAALGSTTRTVQVGKNGLTFTPDSFSAAVGDTIIFDFNPLNHSVVQSNFQNPCIPLAQSQMGAIGFNSGFQPVPANSTTKKTFTIKVSNTQPIWFYCAQVTHCQKGMVGVINPPAASPQNNISAFKALAASATTAVAPATVVSTPYATATESVGATPSGYTAGGAAPSAGSSSASGSAASASSTGAAAPTAASRQDVYAGLAMAGIAAVAMGL